jgi:hypothetical protein
LFSGANQLVDITNEAKFEDLLGLTWEQIVARYPQRMQLLADQTYELAKRSNDSGQFSAYHSLPLLSSSDVAVEPQLIVPEMNSEQRLECLRIAIRNRYFFWQVSAPFCLLSIFAFTISSFVGQI